MPSWQNSLSLTNTWNKTAKTNSSPLKIGKRGRPTVKFPATKTFSLVPFFARNSIDSVTPLTKELVTEVMEKKSFTQVIFDSLGGEQVSSVEEYNKTATYTPGCRTSHLDVSRDKEALKAGPWFKNYKKLGGSNQKEVWNDIWILMLKTTSSENPVCRLDFPFKEAQIRPFKSYPKNLCQVNSKKKQQISKCKFNCIAYTAKKQVWEKGIKVPWLSAMEECIVPLQWCYLKKVSAPSYGAMHPPIFRAKWILRFSGMVSFHSKKNKDLGRIFWHILKIHHAMENQMLASFFWSWCHASISNMCSTIVRCRWPDSK